MQKDIFDFLEHKTLYYDKIDFSIVHQAWDILKSHIKLPYVIHIVGTNGKGSTGRYLASYLHENKYDILHYSSPHIHKFNERIWINGLDVKDQQLQEVHDKFLKIFSKQLLNQLTYFEYTTLIALYLSTNRDYIVLEAGLGGEFDATNVVQNDLTLVTTIGLDHQSFLGDTIEQIALTKMRSCDKNMMVGYQQNDEVFELAKTFEKENKTVYSYKEFELPIYRNKKLPQFLHKNIDLVMSALRYLSIPIEPEVFDKVRIAGRFERINDKITVDVGHNPLAAKEIIKNFSNNKVTLVYNSYADKQYESVLQILRPIIESVEIIFIDDERMVSSDILFDIAKVQGIPAKRFTGVDSDKFYFVFGSFLVVEEFLKKFNEK